MIFDTFTDENGKDLLRTKQQRFFRAELALADENMSWNTYRVLVPADTPDEDIEKAAIKAYQRESQKPKVHIWLYWFNRDELYDENNQWVEE